MLMGQDPQLPSSNDSDNLYNRFMNKYPYALSNIVIAGILMFSFIMGFYFLKKLILVQNKRDIGLEIGDFILNKLGYERRQLDLGRTKRSRIEPNLEQSQLTQDSSDTISSLSSDDDNSNQIVNSSTNCCGDRIFINIFSLNKSLVEQWYSMTVNFFYRSTQLFILNFTSNACWGIKAR